MGRILKKKQRESNAAGAEGRETLKGRRISSCGCSRGRPKGRTKNSHWFWEGGGDWDLRTVSVEWEGRKEYLQDTDYFWETGREE